MGSKKRKDEEKSREDGRSSEERKEDFGFLSSVISNEERLDFLFFLFFSFSRGGYGFSSADSCLKLKFKVVLKSRMFRSFFIIKLSIFQ
jgi:hypothetical protein